MSKIFISYTARDRKWADWIGVTLRDKGHVPFVHEWEIGAGGNIPRWMDERIKAAECLLAVFTDAYADAIYSSTERCAAYWNDPAGREGFLVPVEVEKVSDWPPLTKPLKRLSLVGLTEAEAEAALLKFLEPPEPPDKRPAFPGGPFISIGATLEVTSGLDAAAFTDRSGSLPAERPPLPASVPGPAGKLNRDPAEQERAARTEAERKAAEAARLALERACGKYLENVWTETAYIDIRGLATGRPTANRFSIEDLYIELGAAGEETEAGRNARLDRLPLKAALQNKRLVIIGDPGCGKTTFLQWVAHCLAGDRLGRAVQPAGARLGLDRARLPVLVPIAEWLDFINTRERRNAGPELKAGAQWLPDYLGKLAEDAEQDLSADAFRTLLRAGECHILLDGLDEAPDHQQCQQAVKIIEALTRAYQDCPLVVTSRPAAFQDKAVLPGFVVTQVDALDSAAIRGFLTRWSRALNPDRPDKAESHQRELWAALESRPEIQRMARNTVMLTALAVVHWNEKRLPEQRAELYEAILKWLITSREWRPGREKPQRCRQHLAELALAMQADRRGRQVQVTRRWAAERLAARFGGDGDATDRAEDFLAKEEVDSGIIVRRGHQIKFWHLTFQEYLAAWALAGRQDADRTRLLLAADGAAPPALYRPQWRETVLLLAGVLCLQGEDKMDGLVSAVLDQLSNTPTLADQSRAAGLLGAFVRDLQPFGYQVTDPRYADLLKAAMAVFDPQRAPTIPVRDRIAAADALALSGDPRLGWTAAERWVNLLGGEFRMGAQKRDPNGPQYDPDASDDESPVHRVIVDAFRIARFPVTVTEYAEFNGDDDVAVPRWWQSGGAARGPKPEDWEDQLTYPSRPVVGVSWYQAMAFCDWLTARLRRPRGAHGEILLAADQVVRLPTEAEWEYAARGIEGRRYPWGDTPPSADRINLGIGHATPVGIFPADKTPEGVLDMAGNVSEWCLDWYDRNFYGQCNPQGTRNPLASSPDLACALRGGSGLALHGVAHSAYRSGFDPESRFKFIGFRLVCSSLRFGITGGGTAQTSRRLE